MRERLGIPGRGRAARHRAARHRAADGGDRGRAGALVGSLLVALLVGGVLGSRITAGERAAPAPAPAAAVASTAAREPVVAHAGGRVLHVAGDARGDAAGDGSASRPWASVQRALIEARAGDTVLVHAGRYSERLRSVRPGLPDRPIRLVGRGAELDGGGGGGHLVELTHGHIELVGFSLSGADTLVWVEGATGVRVLDNHLHDAGHECVRLKAGATDNEVARNRVERCGRIGFDLDRGAKNGEGIYLGTAPEQIGRNPERGPDPTNGNWVHDNQVVTPAECIEVKEHALGNVVERNACRGGRDPKGAGIASRGVGTVLRDNVVTANAGAGIRLGGDGLRDGVATVVVGNTLAGNRGFGLLVRREPQGLICGNRVHGNGRGSTNVRRSPDRVCGDQGQQAG
jgi:hypothetical protein